MRAHRAEHRVATMCRVLEVSTSGYYAWLQRTLSDREREDARLLEKIKMFHKRSRGTYGAPRIYKDLLEDGEGVGVRRVARLMRAAGLRGVCRRKFRRTTVRDSGSKPARDLVNRNFKADGPNRLWVADITYIPTWEGFLYLAIVLDVFSRKIVGWAMASHLRTELVLEALRMAMWRRQASGVVHHSDHGCQYTSVAFGQHCREAGILLSMGSAGDCYDNAMAESFFATLECELIDRESWRTRGEARNEVFRYIEGWHNPHRRHSALGYLSPTAYERRHAATA